MDPPLILAGPIARRLVSRSFAVWVATSVPAVVKLSVWPGAVQAGTGIGSFNPGGEFALGDAQHDQGRPWVARHGRHGQTAWHAVVSARTAVFLQRHLPAGRCRGRGSRPALVRPPGRHTARRRRPPAGARVPPRDAAVGRHVPTHHRRPRHDPRLVQPDRGTGRAEPDVLPGRLHRRQPRRRPRSGEQAAPAVADRRPGLLGRDLGTAVPLDHSGRAHADRRRRAPRAPPAQAWERHATRPHPCPPRPGDLPRGLPHQADECRCCPHHGLRPEPPPGDDRARGDAAHALVAGALGRAGGAAPRHRGVPGQGAPAAGGARGDPAAPHPRAGRHRTDLPPRHAHHLRERPRARPGPQGGRAGDQARPGVRGEDRDDPPRPRERADLLRLRRPRRHRRLEPVSPLG